MQSTTTNELIDYLLNETSLEESVQVQRAIDSDFQVHEEFEKLKESIDVLDHVLMEPDTDTIEVILRYSEITKALQV